MKLFDFFRKKEPNTFSEDEIEEEYKKAQKKVQKIDGRNCASLVRSERNYAEKTCIPKMDDDPLAKKSEFMRIYAFRAQQWHYYHTLAYKQGKFNSVPLWTQKWHDYEQGERLQAQKAWNQLVQKHQITQKVR